MKSLKIIHGRSSVFFPRVRAREVSGDGFTVELRDIGDAIPVEVRLRRLLKLALRQCSFRCVGIRMAKAETQGNAVEPNEQDAGGRDAIET